jgi:hypothetical protein
MVQAQHHHVVCHNEYMGRLGEPLRSVLGLHVVGTPVRAHIQDISHQIGIHTHPIACKLYRAVFYRRHHYRKFLLAIRPSTLAHYIYLSYQSPAPNKALMADR